MRYIAVERARELDLVVGVDPRVVLATRDGDVSQALIDQLLARALGVDVNQDASCSLPLAAVARDRVPVVCFTNSVGERRSAERAPSGTSIRIPRRLLREND